MGGCQNANVWNPFSCDATQARGANTPADKKLNYGQITKFEKPIELSKDPIYADPTYFDRILRQGDSTTRDEGNNDANDFFDAPQPPDNEPTEKIGITSEIPDKATDTIKGKKGNEKKPDEKKPATTAIKPADDKTKKAEKPKTNNDY